MLNVELKFFFLYAFFFFADVDSKAIDDARWKMVKEHSCREIMTHMFHVVFRMRMTG